MPRVPIKPGEKIIYQGHPCWRAIIGFYLKGALAAFIFTVFIHFLVTQNMFASILVFIILMSLAVLAGFIKRWATIYTITDKRLEIRVGIVSRNIQQTRLQRIQNVESSQSVYQRLMRIGDVEFYTAGTEESNFFFYGVDSPLQIADKVNSAISWSANGEGLGDANNPDNSQTV